MAELDSWAIGATTDRRVGTEDARRAINALFAPGNSAINARNGIRPTAGSPGLVQATGTPGATVTVNAFQAVLDLAARPGAYIATLDATKTVDVLGANPADPSNQRNDLIIAQQNDADYGDANRNFQVVRVTGTPSGSPVDPTPSGSPNYIKLARIRVIANATVIDNAHIDDLRPAWVASFGGLLPIINSTDRATLTPYAGMPIYRLDRNWVEVYDGTGWRVQGVAQCSSTADRDAAITSPYNGQWAFTTDTNTVWVRASGAWSRFPPTAQSDTQNTSGSTTSTTYTATLSGGTACGVSFTAPPSGAVLIFNNAFLDHIGASQNSFCTIRVRTGSTIGSGSDFLAASDTECISNFNVLGRQGVTRLLTGLTPGSSYNVQQLFRADAGTTIASNKHLIVSPS